MQLFWQLQPHKKPVVLTLKQKLDICKRLEKGESRHKLMEEYNIGSSTLYDIKAQSSKIKDFYMKSKCGEKALSKRHTLHTARLEDLDLILYEWFLDERAEGKPVSGPTVVAQAREIYEKMGIEEKCEFSQGWRCSYFDNYSHTRNLLF